MSRRGTDPVPLTDFGTDGPSHPAGGASGDRPCALAGRVLAHRSRRSCVRFHSHTKLRRSGPASGSTLTCIDGRYFVLVVHRKNPLRIGILLAVTRLHRRVQKGLDMAFPVPKSGVVHEDGLRMMCNRAVNAKKTHCRSC